MCKCIVNFLSKYQGHSRESKVKRGLKLIRGDSLWMVTLMKEEPGNV